MENSAKQRNSIYLIGAITTIFVLCGIILDMVIGSITGGDISSQPQNAVDRFIQFQNNWALGLYNLDLLNMINQIILIPSVFALYIAHKENDNGYALLAFILFVVGSTVFITGNTALAMFDLSKKYFSAISDIQRNMIAAAGESMLAKGAHGSLSVFIGFALPAFANILISHVMIQRKIFTKGNSYIGLAGNTLMLFYIIMVTFYPAADKVALLVAMPGGLLVMTWMTMYMIKLFKLWQTEK